MSTTNIPPNIIEAIIYIIALDDLQVSEGSGGLGTYKWQDWHWTLEESQFWTSLRLIVEPYLHSYANKKTISTEQRETVKLTIKKAHRYSSYETNGHRLMLKIAAHGDMNDWTVANIKYGTPLAKKRGRKKNYTPEMLQPIIVVKKNMLGEMQVCIINPEAPKSKKLPEGMKFAKVYLFVGEEPPKNINDFRFYGNAKRGLLPVNFADVDFKGNPVLYAFFVGRYESNRGVLGQPGAVASAKILYQ